MSVVKKMVLSVLGMAVLVGGFAVQDWYRFAKYSEIDPQRGIFGNDHLEVWIDINAAMPAPMRKWACKTLLDRQAAILGDEGMSPYGCSVDQAMIDSIIANATLTTQSRGASKDQLAAFEACMAMRFTVKKIEDAQTAMRGATRDPATISATVLLVGEAATLGCLMSAGL